MRNTVKRERKKITKHVRKQFRSEKDSNYGPNAEKPDMANNIYELEAKNTYGNVTEIGKIEEMPLKKKPSVKRKIRDG